jgi:hypothetical protein
MKKTEMLAKIKGMRTTLEAKSAWPWPYRRHVELVMDLEEDGRVCASIIAEGFGVLFSTGFHGRAPELLFNVCLEKWPEVREAAMYAAFCKYFDEWVELERKLATARRRFESKAEAEYKKVLTSQQTDGKV